MKFEHMLPGFMIGLITRRANLEHDPNATLIAAILVRASQDAIGIVESGVNKNTYRFNEIVRSGLEFFKRKQYREWCDCLDIDEKWFLETVKRYAREVDTPESNIFLKEIV